MNINISDVVPISFDRQQDAIALAAATLESLHAQSVGIFKDRMELAIQLLKLPLFHLPSKAEADDLETRADHLLCLRQLFGEYIAATGDDIKTSISICDRDYIEFDDFRSPLEGIENLVNQIRNYAERLRLQERWS